MCGLAGVWRRGGGKADPADVERMLATIAHRGPDDFGFWQDGAVALGHRRLTILDRTNRAHQPMQTPDGTGVLIYNGEVYNCPELRKELQAEGIAFFSSGDAEVVLHALHHWGPEASVPRFNGMFAFAYLDRRVPALWLARDRVGIKPLVVADIGDELVFASEVKALLAHPRIPQTISASGIGKWIAAPRQHAHRLLLEGIDGPSPGTWWRVVADRIEKHRYFHVLTSIDVDRLIASRNSDAASLVDEAARLVRNSVKSHLASDVPLAAMCSGGVDSSMITAYAKEYLPNITGYVADLTFADSEAAQAERVGRHLGVKIRRVRVDRERFLRLWPRAIWHSDGPLLYRSDPALLAVTEACHADGIKVLLTGEGADELFGGYSKYRSTYRRWKSLEWPRSLLRSKSSIKQERLRLLVAPFGPYQAHTLRTRMAGGIDYSDDFLAPKLLDLLRQVEPAADRAFIAHCLADLSEGLSTLLHRHDRMGMAASIEMRVPFLENDIFDFAFHLPRRARLHGNIGKWVIKQAAIRELPQDIVYARKKAFPTPRSFVRGTERLLIGGLLAERLRWAAEPTRDNLAMLEADERLRFHLVGLEIWLRLLDGEGVESLGERLVALAA